MRNKNIILGVFLVVGILFLLGTVLTLYSGVSKVNKGIETVGIIIDLDVSISDDKSKSYFPIIEFTTQDNQKIEFRSSMGGSSYRGTIGQSIDVLYDPETPHDAVINSLFGIYGLSIIFGIFGGIFTLIGGIPFAFGMVRKKKNAHLLREGTPIQVKITGIEKNTMIQINKKSPYQIMADVHDKSINTIKRYKSDNIYFDPTPYIVRENVTIYIDKNNANKYYMDVSFLPKIK